jgi:conjugal transfer pilus assembly protein TraW
MRALLIALIMLPVAVFAKDLGTVGNTYPIAEKDMIHEIEDRASNVDWASMFKQEEEKIREEAGRGKIHLPASDNATSYLIDMTYTLDKDIPKVNPQGQIVGVLYPKGYKFNPLEYMVINETYVIFNGSKKVEVDWFISNYKNKPLVYPLLSEGNVFEVAEKLGRPVYLLDEQIKKLFRIEQTVSVVYPEGKFMRVDVLRIKDEENNIRNNINIRGL